MGSTDKYKVQSDKRTIMAFEYIRGKGIEIGASHQPLTVQKNVRVLYTNQLTEDEIKRHFSELGQVSTVKTDIIDDVQTLNRIKDESLDFCIANHVLEHIKDPIGSVLNWLRILKPGGILYISVLDAPTYLDNERSISTLEHFLADHTSPDNRRDYAHHFHTFNKELIEKFIYYVSTIRGASFRILDRVVNEMNGKKELIYILEKDISVDNITYILDGHKANNNTTINPTLDIIVPIYNAYDDLLKCLYSLVKYQINYRIVLINDKSTDKRIYDLFSQLKCFESNELILLENEENRGFVGTVNRGMKYSNNDIILLNSDTIVTTDWTEKLTNCAYSNPEIGTVTPFTNNGTICSIPNFCESNKIPVGFTIDCFAEFVEKISLKRYPEIPTAVGFCMYIKREVLNKIGYFDEETFGKGYGEENDFCMRVINLGYKNVLCDNTFIFHKGEASFSDTKKELINKNLQLLSKRYPEYFPMVAEFCQSNPLVDLHKIIKLREKTWDFNNKKRVLYILHNLGGGTEKHVFDLMKNMKGYVFYIAQVVEKQLIITEINNDTSLEYKFQLSEYINLTTLYSESYRETLERVINTFKIDIIHVQHLIGHPLDVFDVAQKSNIPLFFTVHDFYTICPRINLLNENLEYCNQSNLGKCSTCLMETTDLPLNYITIWRNNLSDIFKKCDKIIAPSSSAIKILNKYYPDIEKKCSVIGHGHNEEISSCKNNNVSRKEKIFHIAYIGVLALHKGSKVFYELANLEELKGKVKWSIFGTSDIKAEIGYNPDQNIHFYGKYDDFNHLRKLVHEEEVDLVILPAVWPETFSYTLSEAWALKLPVLVSNLGALGERVEKNGGGWIADFKSISNVKNLIKNIIDTPTEYLDKKKEVELIHLKTFHEMALEYEELYRGLH